MITLIEPESGLMDCIGPKLKRAHQDFVVVALDDFCQTRSVEFGSSPSLSLQVGLDRYWLGADINSISKTMLQTFCDVDDSTFWINEPIRAWQTQYYGYQLRLAELSGFRVPNTLISNNMAEINSFQERYNSDVIKIKPAALKADMQIFRQAITGGDRIRVYVFGEKTFPFNLGPFHESHDGSPAQHFMPLNADVSKSLARFMRMSRLDFGIFDLCLNNNHDMMWVSFSTDVEKLTRDDMRAPFAGLCDALADVLVKTAQ